MTKVKKRNNEIVPFDETKIHQAIDRAMAETVLGVNTLISDEICEVVKSTVYHTRLPFVSVEFIQGCVLDELDKIRPDVAKVYKEYKENRAKARANKQEFKLLDDEFISQYKHRQSNMSPLGQFVYNRTYSRFLPEENRREYWWETVRRAVEYNCSLSPSTTKEEAQELYDNMFNLRQFLSGRTMWVGGTKVAKDFTMANFNCAFQIIDDVEAFSELLYLLMLGSGVGLRILKEDVKKLPPIRTDYKLVHKIYHPISKGLRFDNTMLNIEGDIAIINVGDSKTGWSDSMKVFFELLVNKKYKHIKTILIDYDSIRPKGEKLKTFGGTASGHEALLNMFTKIDKVIKKEEVICGDFFLQVNKKLKPIDCLDIANIIGEGVVVGGVRRTAEIVLFDSDDQECVNAKNDLYKEVNGEWIPNTDILHRSMSNNSIFYQEKPTREQLHWQIEKMRYSGEPAWVNQTAGLKRRADFNGVNPCGEVLLDNKGMCNLTTMNVMSFVKYNPRTDYYYINTKQLFDAQVLSARAGFRMTLVDLDLPEWDKVQKRDRVIGCSLTGWQDMVNATKMNKLTQALLLRQLREVAHIAVKQYAKELGINEPLLVTTLKPEGTLSQLPVVSSGIHYSHSPYYIRRIRINAQDPLVKVCEELGYPIKPEVGQTLENCTTKVLEFPVQAPKGRTKYDVSAIEQLENYKMFMENYVDHNCSITVHVREHEWEAVEQWVWDNWDDVVAVTFLSLDDSFYDLMPYEAITEQEYLERKSKMKPFIPSLISKYEFQEQEIHDVGNDGCDSGICPIV